MSTILAADTSTSFCTVALWRDGALLAESTLAEERLHSERLLAMIDDLLRSVRLELREIDVLAITTGPGSFTGLRVGVSAFKGLALGAGKPLVGVSTLDAMARIAPLTDGVLCPLIDARMDEVYGARYRVVGGTREKLCADTVGPVEMLLEKTDGPVYCLGDGAIRYRDRILATGCPVYFAPPESAFPRAAAVAAEAAVLLELGTETNPGLIEPVYLRKSQAEEARDARALEQADS